MYREDYSNQKENIHFGIYYAERQVTRYFVKLVNYVCFCVLRPTYIIPWLPP